MGVPRFSPQRSSVLGPRADWKERESRFRETNRKHPAQKKGLGKNKKTKKKTKKKTREYQKTSSGSWEVIESFKVERGWPLEGAQGFLFFQPRCREGADAEGEDQRPQEESSPLGMELAGVTRLLLVQEISSLHLHVLHLD